MAGSEGSGSVEDLGNERDNEEQARVGQGQTVTAGRWVRSMSWYRIRYAIEAFFYVLVED